MRMDLDSGRCGRRTIDRQYPMTSTLTGNHRLTLIMASLHVLFVCGYVFWFRTATVSSALLSLLLVFSCALLCGRWAGLASGVMIAAVQIGVHAADSGLQLSDPVSWTEIAGSGVLPFIGLLTGITAEKFGVRNRRLASRARDLEVSNRSLLHRVDHLDRAIQNLSETPVYPRIWDSWILRNPTYEKIAGLLLSASVLRTVSATAIRPAPGARTRAGTVQDDCLSGLLFTARPDVFAALDPDGTIRCVNPLLAGIFCIGFRDAVGRKLGDFLLPDDVPRAEENIAGALRDELDSGETYGIASPDGGFGKMLISPSIRLERAGNPVMLIARVAEDALRTDSYAPGSAARGIRTLAQLAARSVCCIAPDGSMPYSGRLFAEIAGAPPEDLEREGLQRYVSKKSPRVFRDWLLDMEKGDCTSADIELMPVDGTRRILHLDAFPAVGRSGRVFGAAVLAEDATEATLVGETLRHRLAMEKLISDISKSFISLSLDKLDEEIRQVLLRICEVEGVEEASVEIYRSGRIRHPARYQVSRSERTADARADETETIAIPVVVESEKMGFFQFCQHRFANSWFESDLELIRLIGEIIINALIRKENELRILLNERRLSTTLHSIGDAVIATDNDTRVIMMNKTAEILTGWSAAEADGQPLERVFQPYADADPETDGLSGDEYAHVEPPAMSGWKLRSRTDTVCYVSVTRNPIENASGGVFGEVIVFRDITREKEESDKIRYISFHDRLTGLFNRAYFEEEMIRLNTPRQYPITILLGDCNGLKIANDIFGHLEGDKLLQNIAGILRKATRHEDIVARWGGDEFAIILPRTDEPHAGPIRDRILQMCDESPNDPIRPSLAIGYATGTDGPSDLVALLKLAEDRMYRHKLTEGKSTRNSILLSIEKMLYEKSCETEEHANRMADISVRIGQAIGLNDYEMEELSLLSKLHDMGKIGIPDSILLKPGKLDAEEWELMKKHSEKGYELAQSTPELKNIAEYILHHHERWDGGGYPAGLKGEEIPKLSRVLAIIDTYDVITHSRAYKPVQSAQEALEEIDNCSGKQFDPEISRVFIDIMKEEE